MGSCGVRFGRKFGGVLRRRFEVCLDVLIGEARLGRSTAGTKGIVADTWRWKYLMGYG